MGLFDKLKKKAKDLIPDNVISNIPLPQSENPTPIETMTNYTVRTFEPSECGGFNFVNVPVHEIRYMNTETGEIEDSRENIYLAGDNLMKVVSALQTVANAADESGDYVDDWIPFDRWVPMLIEAIATNSTLSCRYDGSIEYTPYTPTGKDKKFPVEALLDVRFSTPIQNRSHPDYDITGIDSAICRFWFYKSGELGKFQISYFADHANFGICSNVAEDKGQYYLVRVRILKDATSHKWVEIYPK